MGGWGSKSQHVVYLQVSKDSVIGKFILAPLYIGSVDATRGFHTLDFLYMVRARKFAYFSPMSDRNPFY